MAGPLENLTVLDLTRVLAGPWASQTLADLGATVIKIERPGVGDDTRGWGPPFIENADGSQGDAAYFLSANRGKHSVAIDMATERGQALIRDLAVKADIVIENFKLDGLKKYHLDYQSLAAFNPRLIYCSITGFGQNGPYAARAGYDFMIQGMGGIMSITGQPDGAEGAEPMKSGVAFADIFTGLYSTIGILAAVEHRNKTGEGQYIDMALLDCQVGVLANQAMNYLVADKPPQRLGNAHPNIVPYQAFATLDGHLILAVGNDRQFAAFCEIAGLDGVAEDPRFVSNRARVENRQHLTPMVAAILASKTTEQWIDLLEKAAVPCGPINTLDQVFADPQVTSRGLAINQTRPDGTKIPGVANPIRLSKSAVDYNRAAPALAADTTTILGDLLAMSDEEMANLKRDGVIDY